MTTAGIVMTCRASCSCRWKAPVNITASQVQRAAGGTWAMSFESLSGAALRSTSLIPSGRERAGGVEQCTKGRMMMVNTCSEPQRGDLHGVDDR